MLLYELRKCLLNYRCLLIIIVALILKLLFLNITIKEPKYHIRMDYDFFIEISQKISGRYTDENKAYLLSLLDEISNAESEINRLNGEVIAGKTDINTFTLAYYELRESTKHREAVDILYKQYQYIECSPDDRYFAYLDGWERLLGNTNVDMILLLVILFLTAPIFLIEYESGTIILLLCGRNGKKMLAFQKILCATFCSIFITLLFALVEWVYIQTKFPLNYSDFPIQSIEIFSELQTTLSLIQSWELIVLLRIFGAMFTAVITCCFEVIFFKMAPTVLNSALLVITPIFLFNDASVIQILPIPIAYLCSANFLMENYINSKILVPSFSFSVIIMIISCLISIFSYTNGNGIKNGETA